MSNTDIFSSKAPDKSTSTHQMTLWLKGRKAKAERRAGTIMLFAGLSGLSVEYKVRELTFGRREYTITLTGTWDQHASHQYRLDAFSLNG